MNFFNTKNSRTTVLQFTCMHSYPTVHYLLACCQTMISWFHHIFGDEHLLNVLAILMSILIYFLRFIIFHSVNKNSFDPIFTSTMFSRPADLIALVCVWIVWYNGHHLQLKSGFVSNIKSSPSQRNWHITFQYTHVPVSMVATHCSTRVRQTIASHIPNHNNSHI